MCALLACICQSLSRYGPLAIFSLSNFLHFGVNPLLGDLLVCMLLHKVKADLSQQQQYLSVGAKGISVHDYFLSCGSNK